MADTTILVNRYRRLQNLATILKNIDDGRFADCWPHYLYVNENSSILNMRPAPESHLMDIKTAMHNFYYYLELALQGFPATDANRNIMLAECKNYDSRELFKIEQADTKVCECGTLLSGIDGLMTCTFCNRICEGVYDDGPSMESGEDIKVKKSNIAKHWAYIMSQIYGEVTDEIPSEIINGVRLQLERRNINIMNAANYSNAMGEALKQIGSINGVSLKKYIPVKNNFIKRIYNVEIPRLNYTKTSKLRFIFLRLASARFVVSRDTKYQARYCYTIARIIYLTMSTDPTSMALLRFIDMGNTRTFAKNDEMLAASNQEAGVFSKFEPTSDSCYTDPKYYLPFHN